MNRIPDRSRRAYPHADLPFELDEACQRFIAEHPGGATLDECGQFLGVSRERVRQVEAAALHKLAQHARAEFEQFASGPSRQSIVDRIYEAGP